MTEAEWLSCSDTWLPAPPPRGPGEPAHGRGCQAA
jgi:hypothetical protein